MSQDVYRPCPCGSGNKFKFCCHDIADEMEKITSLQEKQQSSLAFEALARLEAGNKKYPWVSVSYATALLTAGQHAKAKQVLRQLLESNPDHKLALALYASSAFAADGFEKAKSILHRSFQLCSREFPDVNSGIAMGIAGAFFASHSHMAAREHLVLAMRMAREEDQQEIFLRLLEFDSNNDVPYPLRSVHHLADAPDDESAVESSKKARRYAELGCFNRAAELYTELANKHTEHAGLRQNAGLCSAWDGQEEQAAEMLHQAAKLHGEVAAAVECETIAQLIELESADRQIHIETVEYEIHSAAKLLTQLGEADQLVRLELPEESNSPRPPVAVFQIIDCNPEALESADSLTLDTVPNILGQLAIYDAVADADLPALAILAGHSGQSIEQAEKQFESAVDGELKKTESTEFDQDISVESYPQELSCLHWRWYFTSKVSGVRQQQLLQEKWKQALEVDWPTTSLKALGGKSPTEATEDADLKVALSGAIYALDAYANRSGYAIDTAALFDKFGLEAPAEIELEESTPLNTFSSMGLNRLPVKKLSDAQLSYTLNRALLIHHSRFLYEVLLELLERPQCLAEIDLDRAYATLADLCRDRFQRDEVLRWLKSGGEYAKTQERAFENSLQWSVRELACRLEDPEDPEIQPQLKHLWEYYGSKLPQLRDYLENMVKEFGISAPWESASGIILPGSGSLGNTIEPAEAGEEKKIYLPGQD